MKEPFKKRLPWLLLLTIIFLGILTEIFLPNDVSYENPNLLREAEASVWVDRVGKLIVLPENEMPSVAEVSDPAMLKDQNFFSQAEKGDIVLIYSGAKKAILYNKEKNIIISVASINIKEGEEQKNDFQTQF